MSRRLAALILAFILCAAACICQAAADDECAAFGCSPENGFGVYRCTASDGLNINSGHNYKSHTGTVIPYGALVTVSKKAATATYAHVTYEGISGIASMNYLSPVREADGELTESCIDNLRASDFRFCGTSYSGKKTMMISIAERMLDEGYEPSFVAGVLANVAKEGSCGRFENITGYTVKRLLEVFPGLITCEESGTDHKNYIAHINGFADYDRCGHDHSEYARYNGKYIYNDFSLAEISAMLERYAGEGWLAKFGLGALQWTGGRSAVLFSFYLEVAGDSDTITKEQTQEAEMRMIAHELGGSYKSVYSNWSKANPDKLTSDAAYDAGYRVCYYYERPSNKESGSVTRGNIAREIFTAMGCERREAYALRFDANGGSGTPGDITVSPGSRVPSPVAVPARSGYAFEGWFTSQGLMIFDAQGISANDGVYISDGVWLHEGGLTLSARWRDITPPDITYCYAENLNPAGFDAVCGFTDNEGATEAVFTVWTDDDYQNRLTYPAQIDGSGAAASVRFADFGRVNCVYNITVSVSDAAGNVSDPYSLFAGDALYADISELLNSKSVIALPESVTEIREGAFSGTAAIAVIIPEGCAYIDENAFADMNGLLYIINRSHAEITAESGIIVICE